MFTSMDYLTGEVVTFPPAQINLKNFPDFSGTFTVK
jgi:hypothetical protein